MSVLNSWASLLSAEEKCFVHLKTWSSCLCKMLQFWSLTCVSTDTFFHIAISWGCVVFWSNLNLMFFLLFLPIILLCNFFVFLVPFFFFFFMVFLFLFFLLQDSALGFAFVYLFFMECLSSKCCPVCCFKNQVLFCKLLYIYSD